MIFAFVWASLLPSVKRNSYNNDDAVTEFISDNNKEQLYLKVNYQINLFYNTYTYHCLK